MHFVRRQLVQSCCAVHPHMQPCRDIQTDQAVIVCIKYLMNFIFIRHAIGAVQFRHIIAVEINQPGTCQAKIQREMFRNRILYENAIVKQGISC